MDWQGYLHRVVKAGPGPLAGPNWPPLFPKYLGERSQVENLGSGLYVPPRIAPPPVERFDFRDDRGRR